MSIEFQYQGLSGQDAVLAHRNDTASFLHTQREAQTRCLKRWRKEASQASRYTLEKWLGIYESYRYNYYISWKILIISKELKSRDEKLVDYMSTKKENNNAK